MVTAVCPARLANDRHLHQSDDHEWRGRARRAVREYSGQVWGGEVGHKNAAPSKLELT